MKTQVLVKRKFYQTQVRQRNTDKFFNANDLLNYYNDGRNKFNQKEKRLESFFSNKNTKDYLTSLKNDINLNSKNSCYLEQDLFETKRGKNGGTYMHPYLFVKFAMWLSTDFEVQVIKWVYDNLIDFRNEAGDNYKEMTQGIKNYMIENKIKNPLMYSEEATFLNLLVFGNKGKEQRQKASEKELDLLNRLQKANIKMLKEGLSQGERRVKLRDFKNLLS